MHREAQAARDQLARTLYTLIANASPVVSLRILANVFAGRLCDF